MNLKNKNWVFIILLAAAAVAMYVSVVVKTAYF